MASPTILLISYHFYPANEIGGRRTTALARYLAARGVRVFVVSAFGHRQVQPGDEILPGVTAIPVRQPRRLLIDSLVWLKQGSTPAPQGAPQTPTVTADAPSRPREGIMSRPKALARQLFFRIAYFMDDSKKWAWRASRAAVAAGREHGAHLVLSSAPPNSVLLAGALAAKRLRVPHIADLRDPWTDSILTDPQHRIDSLMQRPLESWVVRSAAGVTSAGATVARALAQRYPQVRRQIHVVRNGYDGQAAPAGTETGGRLSILFAGELYLGRNPFPLLDALETIMGRPEIDASRIRLTFMGRTERYGNQSLAEWIAGKRCASVVRLLPYLPAQAVAEEVSQATVLLNLAQQQPFSVPAKTYEHLISGRENLLICENESETAELVKGLSGVNQVDSRDSPAIEKALLDLYRRHVLGGYMIVPGGEEVRRFSRDAANEQFWSLIDAAAGLSQLLPAVAPVN